MVAIMNSKLKINIFFLASLMSASNLMAMDNPETEPITPTTTAGLIIDPPSVDKETLKKNLPFSLRWSTDLYRTTITSPAVMSTAKAISVGAPSEIEPEKLSPEENQIVEKLGLKSRTSLLYIQELGYKNNIKTNTDLLDYLNKGD